MKITEKAGNGEGILACCDNMKFMEGLLENDELKGKIQTIYVDPPFFTKADYEGSFSVRKGMPLLRPKAYGDRWHDGMNEYISMLRERLTVMKELLSDTGLIWVHLDWHAVHYVKVMMDEIFGPSNFVNEIIWQYKSGGSTKKHFARKHDTILLYSKTSEYRLFVGKEKSYNRGLKPYHFKGVEEFCDETGWYTMVNQKDVWQLDMVGRTSRERTGYATQKPLSLMKRIIESSTREGEYAADFFCGSGSFAQAAAELGRPFICCDSSKIAMNVTRKRLIEGEHGFYFGEAGTEDGGKICSKEGISAQIRAERSPEGNIIVSVEDYHVPESCIPVREKDRKGFLKGVLEGRDLIAYWSIDPSPEPHIHHSRKAVVQTDMNKCMSAVISTSDTKGTVSVMIVDVLGNTGIWRKEIE